MTRQGGKTKGQELALVEQALTVPPVGMTEPEWEFTRWHDPATHTTRYRATTWHEGSQRRVDLAVSDEQLLRAQVGPHAMLLEVIIHEGKHAMGRNDLLAAHALLHLAKLVIEEGHLA